VIVPDDQLSLAIGREGQNARLAARLTGWRIDIRSETEFAAEEAEHGYEEEELQGRCAAILSNGRRCPNAALPGSRYCGIEAHQALAGKGTDQVGPDPEPDPASGAGESPASGAEETAVARSEEPAVAESEEIPAAEGEGRTIAPEANGAPQAEPTPQEGA
jgi:transcription termination/antitermination protein NusA